MSVDDLIRSQNSWETSMGLSFLGERVVFRGVDLFSEFSDQSWMELLIYGITGRKFAEEQYKLFESIWSISTSYPDPRIWNNRVSALAATTRSTACLAVAASTAVSGAQLYGRRPDIRAVDFLSRMRNQIEDGQNVTDIVEAELKKHRAIFGFARPISKEDERRQPLIDRARKLGLGDGKFLNLVFEVEEILLNKKFKMKANIAAVAAGLAADQGLSTREYYYYTLFSFGIGFTTCYIDSLDKPENTFFPFSCDSIKYQGNNDRKW